MKRRMGILIGAFLLTICFASDGARTGDQDNALVPLDDRSQEVDLAVSRGLRFLAECQLPNGGFTGGVGHKQGDGYLLFNTEDHQREDGTGHMGVAALAGLAFLANGHVPERGLYADNIDRIVDYIVTHRNEFGYMTDSGTRMYSHAFATLFLSQVHGMSRTRRDEVDQALREAVGFIEKTQNLHGAWRYSPFTTEADLSVTVCQVQSLRAARNIGIHVNKDCIDRVLDYVKDSRIPSGDLEGAFFYKIYGRSAHTKTSFTVNAAAVTTLHSAGAYDPARYGRAVEYLEENYDYVSARYPYHYYYWYGNYYAAQALHHEGSIRWDRYWRKLRDDLLRRQSGDGSWDNSVGPGDRFSTAMACLLLRVPAQYLPIFQK